MVGKEVRGGAIRNLPSSKLGLEVGARKHSPVFDHPSLVWTLLGTPGAATLFSSFVLVTLTFLGSFLLLSSPEDFAQNMLFPTIFSLSSTQTIVTQRPLRIRSSLCQITPVLDGTLKKETLPIYICASVFTHRSYSHIQPCSSDTSFVSKHI